MKPFGTDAITIFPKRGFVGKVWGFSQIHATYPYVFIDWEITRHDEITNEPILERRIITLVDSIKKKNYTDLGLVPRLL